MEVKVDVILGGDAWNVFGGQTTEDPVWAVDMGEGTIATSVNTVDRSVSRDTVVQDDSLEIDGLVRVKYGSMFCKTRIVSEGIRCMECFTVDYVGEHREGVRVNLNRLSRQSIGPQVAVVFLCEALLFSCLCYHRPGPFISGFNVPF